jgi:hypothetical protein
MAGEVTGNPDKFKVMDLAREFPEVGDRMVVCLEMLEHIEDDLSIIKRIPSGTWILFSVPSYDYKSHVRHFASMGEVYKRYNPYMKVFDDAMVEVAPGKFIYLIQGKRK